MLGLRGSEIVDGPFKSRVLVSYGLPPLPDLSPADFQSQTRWGLVFPVQGWGREYSIQGLNPLLPRKDLHTCYMPSVCESLASPFQTAAFVFVFLGLRASKTAHEPSKKGISVSYRISGPLDVKPIGFASHIFSGLSLQCRSQFPGCPT